MAVSVGAGEEDGKDMTGWCRVEVDPDAHGVTMRIIGDLDAWSGATLQMIVQQQRDGAAVAFDLAAVAFIDAAGLAALLAAARDRGGLPRVLAVSPAVERLLELTPDVGLEVLPRLAAAC